MIWWIWCLRSSARLVPEVQIGPDRWCIKGSTVPSFVVEVSVVLKVVTKLPNKGAWSRYAQRVDSGAQLRRVWAREAEGEGLRSKKIVLLDLRTPVKFSYSHGITSIDG
ncbi:hypothetical protein B0H11DRAFT_1904103 [Mycena galericulata]|nr:hypothetical protein B0H11DRAFT_1904103 [Mycena galericulata]